MSERKPTADHWLLIATLSLVAIGVVIVYSASTVKASVTFGDPNFFFKRHLMRVLLGLFLMWFFMRIDYHIFQRAAKWGLLAAILLMVVMLCIIPTAVRGSVREIDVGPFSFQPSEIAKYTLILYLVDALVRKQNKLQSFVHGFLPMLIVMGVVAGLILLQPDFDHAVMVMFISFLLFFLGGVKIRHLLATGVTAVPFVTYGIFSDPNRLKRLIEHFSSGGDVLSTNYQTNQSLISLGSGGFFGVGIGQSKEKMLFLPEPFTDFIFAILGEEAGFIGAMIVLILFLLLLWRGFAISRRASDLYGSLLAAGITVSLIVSAFINIAMASGLLPAIGLPLPFLSYGGTSLLITMALCGILINIGYAQSRVLGINAVYESQAAGQTPYIVPFRRKAKTYHF